MVMVGHRRPEVEVRTIEWVDDQVVLLDQTRLPREERWLAVTTVDELVDVIRRLAVRGAPLLGAAGALGVLLVVQEAEQEGWDDSWLRTVVAQLRVACPTVVNLARGVDWVMARLSEGLMAVKDET